jgi:hypothetical protein
MSYSRDLTKTEAFREYGATVKNVLNEYSAIANDGSVVLECWTHLIGDKQPDGEWRYQIDDLSTWTNIHGKEFFVLGFNAGCRLHRRRSHAPVHGRL